MSIDVRTAGDQDEYWAGLSQIGQYFGLERKEDLVERFLRVLPLDRLLLASEGDAVVGAAGSFPFELSVPGGGSVPCCGTTVVAVSRADALFRWDAAPWCPEIF